MLENTFIHLPNFGPRRERRLWKRGVLSWDDFLERFGSSPFHRAQCSHVAASRYALSQDDPDYFSSCLPPGETWRAGSPVSQTASLVGLRSRIAPVCAGPPTFRDLVPPYSAYRVSGWKA